LTCVTIYESGRMWVYVCSQVNWCFSLFGSAIAVSADRPFTLAR